MLLAELEVWHTRPLAPTRRVALGHLVLPADPPPGFGGLLLGAVIAAHIDEVDDDKSNWQRQPPEAECDQKIAPY